jgi:adenosine 3'-phospho 5'-phosphosulfate transporter B2
MLCPRPGSLCISFIIKSFGALTLATVMTTRQVLSIALSAIVFRSALTPAQWASAAVVMLALYAKGFMSKGKSGSKQKQAD